MKDINVLAAATAEMVGVPRLHRPISRAAGPSPSSQPGTAEDTKV